MLEHFKFKREYTILLSVRFDSTRKCESAMNRLLGKKTAKILTTDSYVINIFFLVLEKKLLYRDCYIMSRHHVCIPQMKSVLVAVIGDIKCRSNCQVLKCE